MSNFLFVHQNFPGQFPHLSKALVAQGHTVVAIGEAKRLKQRIGSVPGIKLVGYDEPKAGGRDVHHYLRDTQAHIRRGQQACRAAQAVARSGFKPDVVIAHPGWGEALFLKDVFPRAKHIHYLEFFYRGTNADVGFDPEFPATFDDQCRVRIKNSAQLIGLEYADAGLSPTEWQRSRYPTVWQPRIARIHDGIDTAVARPDASAVLQVPGLVPGSPAVELSRSDEVITFVARNLEPYRGFHVFMRFIPELLQRRPKARIVIVGGDDVSYGRKLPDGTTYRTVLQKQWGDEVDRSRIHFLGRVPYNQYLKVLQISSLHLYLTYPFVLSWSLLEALSCQCLVLASDTAPLKEVIRDGHNGFLTSFFDQAGWVRRCSELLDARHDLDAIRSNARATVLEHYDLHRICLPQQLNLLAKFAPK